MRRRIQIPRANIASPNLGNLNYNIDPGQDALTTIAQTVNKFAEAKFRRDEIVRKEKLNIDLQDETAKANVRQYDALQSIINNPENANKTDKELDLLVQKVRRQEDAYFRKLNARNPELGRYFRSNYQTTLMNNLQKFNSSKSKFHTVRVQTYISKAGANGDSVMSQQISQGGLLASFNTIINGIPSLEIMAINNGVTFNRDEFIKNRNLSYLNNNLKFLADKQGNVIPGRDDNELNYTAIYNRLSDIQYGSDEYKKQFGDPNLRIPQPTYDKFVTDIEDLYDRQIKLDLDNQERINNKLNNKYDQIFRPGNEDQISNLRVQDIFAENWQGSEGFLIRDATIKKLKEYHRGELNLTEDNVKLLRALDDVVYRENSEVVTPDSKTITLYDDDGNVLKLPNVYGGQEIKNVSLRDLFGKGIGKNEFAEYVSYLGSDLNNKNISANNRTELNEAIDSIEALVFPDFARSLNPEGAVKWQQTTQILRNRYRDLRNQGISHREAISLDYNNKNSIFYKIQDSFDGGNILNKMKNQDPKDGIEPSSEVKKLYNSPSLKNQKDFFNTYGEDAFNQAVNQNPDVFDEVYNPRLKGFQGFNIQPMQNIVEQVAQVKETEGGLFEIPELLGVEPPPENASEQEKMDYVFDLGMQYVGTLGPVKRIDKLIGPLTKIFNKAVGKSVKNPTAKKHALAYEIFRRKGKDIGAEVDDFEDLTPFIKNPNKTMNEFQVKDFIEFVDEGAEVVVKTDNANKLVVTITNMKPKPITQKLVPKKTQITNPTLQKLIDKGYKLKESDIGINVE